MMMIINGIIIQTIIHLNSEDNMISTARFSDNELIIGKRYLPYVNGNIIYTFRGIEDNVLLMEPDYNELRICHLPYESDDNEKFWVYPESAFKFGR